MPQSADFYDSDFDAQLQGLFQQAERAMSHRAPEVERPGGIEAKSESESGSASANPGAKLPASLQPLMDLLQFVAKSTSDNNSLLRRMDPASSDIVDAQKGMLKLMSDLRAIVEARNTVSQNMFSALHQELKGYKDGFLLQTVHRPIIRDLVTLYDDVAELHRQMAEICAVPEGHSEKKKDSNPLLGRIRQIATNMANNLHFILEVLARLEVTVMPESPGKLDKLTQKAVNVESAATPEEDGLIIRSVKPGFLWKDAVFRPEEVVIKKWKQPRVEKQPDQPEPLDQPDQAEKEPATAEKQPPEAEGKQAGSPKEEPKASDQQPAADEDAGEQAAAEQGSAPEKQ